MPSVFRNLPAWLDWLGNESTAPNDILPAPSVINAWPAVPPVILNCEAEPVRVRPDTNAISVPVHVPISFTRILLIYYINVEYL